MKTADSAHVGILASVTRLFIHFWMGPGNEANARVTVILCSKCIWHSGISTFVFSLSWVDVVYHRHKYLPSAQPVLWLSLSPSSYPSWIFWYDHSSDCSHLHLTCCVYVCVCVCACVCVCVCVGVCVHECVEGINIVIIYPVSLPRNLRWYSKVHMDLQVTQHFNKVMCIIWNQHTWTASDLVICV